MKKIKIINSDVSDRVLFDNSINNLLDYLNTLNKFNDNLKLSKIINYLEVLIDLPIFDPLHSKLSLNLYNKLCLLDFDIGLISRKYDIKNGLAKYNELIEDYFINLLKAAPKYKLSASQYFKLVENGKFDKRHHSIYYIDLYILRITETLEVIIIPLNEILKINLGLNDINSLGDIIIKNKNPYEINFERNYVRFKGVGKDDCEEVQNLSLCIDTFQIKEL